MCIVEIGMHSFPDPFVKQDRRGLLFLLPVFLQFLE